jgi:hypothetical protein
MAPGTDAPLRRRLAEVALLFLKLGFTAFGARLISLMHNGEFGAQVADGRIPDLAGHQSSRTAHEMATHGAPPAGWD